MRDFLEKSPLQKKIKLANKSFTSTTSTSANNVSGRYIRFENSPITSTSASVIQQKKIIRTTNKPKTLKDVLNVESAVYSYIQAMRALGKTQLTANQIAVTLSLSLSEVTNVIEKLHTKGVKIISR